MPNSLLIGAPCLVIAILAILIIALNLYWKRKLSLAIIKQQDAESSLEQRAGMLSAVMNVIPSLLWFSDEKGVYLGCNRSFTKLMGNPPITNCS